MSKIKNLFKKAGTLAMAVLTVLGTAGTAVAPVQVHAETPQVVSSTTGTGAYRVSGTGRVYHNELSIMWLGGQTCFCIEPGNIDRGAVGSSYEVSGDAPEYEAGVAYICQENGNTPRYSRAAQFLIWQSRGWTVEQTFNGGQDVTAEMNAINNRYTELKNQGYTFSAKEYHSVGYTPSVHQQNIIGSATMAKPTVDVTVTANVHKTSANPSITDGNGNYSLEGAVFNVSVTGPATWTGTMTTDANGNANFSHTFAEMPAGTKESDFDITITETAASKGYMLNGTPFTVKSGGTANVPESPRNDPVGISIEKVSDDGVSNPKSLAGAVFEIHYYAVDPNSVNSVTDLAGRNYETWTGETSKLPNGKYGLSMNAIKGNSHKDRNGNNTIPIGVLTIQETKAPAGYTLNNKVVTVSGTNVQADANGVVMLKIESDNSTNGARITFGNEYTIRETPVRQGFSLVKYDNETGTNSVQGDATSLRAGFQVINNNNFDVVSIDGNGTKRTAGPGQVVYEFYTNDDGTFTSNNTLLSSGNYIVKEVEPPVGYTLNGTTETALTISDNASQNGMMIDLTGSIADTPIRGGFKFQKKDAETNTVNPQGNAVIGPADYQVINDSANKVKVNDKWYGHGEVVYTFQTDDNGSFTSPADLLPYGTYTIKETSAPTGYELDSTAAAGIQIQIRNNGEIVSGEASNTPTRGSFKMAKRDYIDKSVNPEGNASLLGATYDVINKSNHPVLVDKNQDGVPDPTTELFNSGDVVYEFTTSKDNTKDGVYEAPLKLLPYGSYTLVEVQSPEGYQLDTKNGATLSVDFTIQKENEVVDLTGTNKISNTPKRGTFSVEKKDLDLGTNRAQGDNNLSGKYALINKSKHAVYVDTDGDGKIDLKAEKFEPGEVIRDRSRDDSSKKEQYSFETAEDGTFSWTVPEDGKGSYWAGLPYGSYAVKEVEAPRNYTTKGTTLISFDITEDGQKIDRTRNLEIDPKTKYAGKADDEIIANRAVYGKTEVFKHINKPSGSQFSDLPENNAKFLVILTSKLNSLYGGNMKTAWDALKDQNGNNILDEKGNVILSGHEFSIITTGTEKDEDGDIMEGYGLSGDLATGNYTIMQMTSGTADGYDPTDVKMRDESKNFDITANETTTVDGYQEWNDYKSVKNKWTVANDEKVYELRILKKDAATGKLVTLNGASFQIYLDINQNGKLDAEDKAYSSVKSNGDIDTKYYSDINGTTKVVNGLVTMTYGGANYNTFRTYTDNNGGIKKGTFVADLVNGRTNIKGSAVQPLKLLRGHYLIVETDNDKSVDATPEGYLSQKEPLAFTVDGTHYQNVESSTFDNVNENIITKVFSWFDHATNWLSGTKRMENDDEYFVTETVANDRAWGELKVNKKFEPLPEDTDYSYIDRKEDLKKIEFTLYAAEDIIDPADGSIITKKGEIAKIYNPDTKGYTDIGVYHPDENGKIDGKYIPLGKYTLKETKVPEGVVLQGDKEWDATFTQPADDRKTSKFTAEYSIENYTTKTSFSKTDVTGEKELEGAELTILNKDGTQVMKKDGTPLTWTSTDKPYLVEGLPIGEYFLHENIAKEGYVLRTLDVPFEVGNNGDVHVVKIENKTYGLKKVDACGKAVKGAEITVTDKADGKVADKWTTDETEHYINNLIEGHTYVVTETKTPEGYVTFKPFEITVNSDYSKNQEVDAVDKILYVSKEDVGGKEIEGAKLTLTDKETGEVIDEWTSGKTEHIVKNAKVGGTYILHEDTSPAGFVKVSDVEFTVTDDGLDQKVTMVDTVDRVSKEDGKGNLVNNAKMQAIDKDGKVIDEWTTGQHVVDLTDEAKKSLEDGTFEYTFTDEQGREITVYAIPKETEENKDKAEVKSGSQAIKTEAGCKIAKPEEKSEQKADVKASEKSKIEVDHYEAKIVDTEGNVSYYDIDTNGNETTHRINNAVHDEKYTIKEVTAADGYYFAEDSDTTASNDKDVTKKVVDNEIAYQITKVDDNDNVLTGVKLQLNDVTDLTRKSKNELTGILPEEEVNQYNAKGTSEEASYVWLDKDNKLVDPETIELPNGGVTNGKPFDITGKLKADHDYELRELDHTAGVFRTNSFVFHVDKIGDGQTITIKMHDANTYIKVRKVDAKGEELEGAHLAVYKAVKNDNGEYVVAKREDGSDDVVVDWTTTKDPIDLSKYLKGSNEYGSQGYILRELEAPKGYKKADDRYFTVTGDKDVYQTIVMLDRKKPEEAKSGTQTDPKVYYGIGAVGTAVLLACIAVVVAKKKAE